jgi:CRP-like cAMP-binding protein
VSERQAIRGAVLRRITTDEVAAVGRIPVFQELPKGAVTKLLGDALVRAVPRSTLLFNQGDVADRFYVVLAGKVKLFTATPQGGEGVVNVISAGGSFGEAAMFASRCFPVNAEAVENSHLVVIRAGSFLRELERNRKLAVRILSAMARRQNYLLRQIGELKLKSPVQRLGSFILALTDVTTGSAHVRLPSDKGLIAGEIGITPESLSRALAVLRGLGVECRRRDVAISDVRALRRFCQDSRSL